MAKTVGFGKLRRGMLSNERLPPDLRVALIDFKNLIRTGGNLTNYENRDDGLPSPGQGQYYVEFQVGQAHPGDPRPRGKRRLVALLDPCRNILRLYFSDSHYTLGDWEQLQYP